MMRHAPPSRRHVRPIALLAVAAALVAAGCASPSPAPIVQRTNPAAGTSRPAVPPPAPVAPPAAPAAEAPVVQTVPVRPGSIESRGIESRPLDARPGTAAPGASGATPPPPPAPALPPNTRTVPRGTKIPYSDTALADLRAAEAAGAAPASGGTGPAAAVVPQAPSGSRAADATRPPEAARPAEPPDAAPAADGEWAWPSGGKVIQSFAESGGKGVAIGGKVGDAVNAAADGRVIFSGNGPRGYGNLVIVKHTNDLLSVYAHNRTLAVKEGQTVKRGQKIAELGDSGASSPRLHFEIRQQGKPVDPARFLPRR